MKSRQLQHLGVQSLILELASWLIAATSQLQSVIDTYHLVAMLFWITGQHLRIQIQISNKSHSDY